MGKRSNPSIVVELILKNQKTGLMHKSLIDFKDGKWVEYLDNLAPGVYVIDEYREIVMGGLLPRRLNSFTGTVVWVVIDISSLFCTFTSTIF